MALHFIKKQWTDHPPAGTPIRADGHWSTQGLIALVALNEGGGSIAVNALGANGAVTLGEGGVFDGKGFTTLSGTTDEYINLGAVLSGRVTNQITIASLMTINAVPGTNRAYHGAGNPLGTCAYGVFSKNTGEFAYRVDSSVSTRYYGSTVPAAGRTYLNVLRYDGANVAAFLNGERDLVDQAQTGNIDNTTQTVRIGYTGSSSVKTAAATFNLFAIWNRALSNAEIKSLSDNPWQMFRPMLIPVVIAASGGTSYTETITDSATAVASLADIANRVESLLESIQATGSVADAVTAVESLLTTIQSAATVTDEVFSGVVENVLTTATGTASATDVQAMVETVLVLVQSGATVGEVGAFVDSVLATAAGTGSVVDSILGQYLHAIRLRFGAPSMLKLRCGQPQSLRLRFGRAQWTS